MKLYKSTIHLHLVQLRRLFSCDIEKFCRAIARLYPDKFLFGAFYLTIFYYFQLCLSKLSPSPDKQYLLDRAGNKLPGNKIYVSMLCETALSSITPPYAFTHHTGSKTKGRRFVFKVFRCRS
jgi:hypothetical protein